jgi:hypothetical protein
LYLAYADSVWFLRKKIELKENIEDLDRYYARHERTINTLPVVLYCTPLHEAVLHGHLGCVQLLCKADADKSKRVKSSYYEILNPESTAFEAKFQSIPRVTYSVEPAQLDTEIKEKCDCDYVGLSAVDLAKKLVEDRCLFDPVSTERRQMIYNFLHIDHEKKNS